MKSNNNHQQNVQQSVQVRHYTDTLAYVEATKFYQRTRIISIKKMSQVSKQQKRQQPKTRQMRKVGGSPHFHFAISRPRLPRLPIHTAWPLFNGLFFGAFLVINANCHTLELK